jgi:O-antigen ligase
MSEAFNVTHSRARWISPLLACLFGALVFIAVLDRLPLSIFGFSVSAYRFLSLPLLITIIFTLLRSGWIPWAQQGPMSLLLLGLLLSMALSSLFSTDPEIALLHLLRYLEYALIALLLSAILCTHWQERYWLPFAWTLLLSALFASATVLTDFWGATAFYRWYEAERPYVRHMGILGAANYGSAKLVVLMPFIFYLGAFYAQRRRWGALSFVIGAGLIVSIALFITGSRMGGLLASIALAVFLLREIRWLRKPRVILLFAAILGLLLTASISFGEGPMSQAFRYVSNRYGVLISFLRSGEESYNRVRESSLRERIEVFRAGLRMFADHPLLGIGLAHFPLVIGEYDPRYSRVYSHNTYLSVLAELGLIGILFFIFLCRQMFFLFHRAFMTDKGFYFYLFLSYILLLIGFLFLHELDNKYFWTLFLPISLYLATLRLARSEKPA